MNDYVIVQRYDRRKARTSVLAHPTQSRASAAAQCERSTGIRDTRRSGGMDC